MLFPRFERSVAWIFFPVFILAGCGGPPENQAPGQKRVGQEPLAVVVSIVPQSWIVDRVGGGLVRVEVLSPPNHSPETYQITPRQMDALGQARVYFRIGMPFEGALVQRLQSAFPDLLVVDTREGVPMLPMDAHHHHDHGETDDGEETCVHGDEDPHIWLDPVRVKIQAQLIAATLISCLPDRAEELGSNLKTVEAELDALDAELEAMLAPVRGKAFYVYHPAFGYLADRYGLEQRAIEFEGKSPGTQRLYEIIGEIKNAGARALFTQPQFNVAELGVIAGAAGVSTVTLDNLSYDYPECLRSIGRAIAESLQ